jgi:hypothetical protein
VAVVAHAVAVVAVVVVFSQVKGPSHALWHHLLPCRLALAVVVLEPQVPQAAMLLLRALVVHCLHRHRSQVAEAVVADLVVPMRLVTLPVINNKMDSRVVLAAAVLVMDHLLWYLTVADLACQAKDSMVDRAVMRRRQPP